MKNSLRICLLAGLAGALALPLAAQDVQPQPVQEKDAAPVAAPAREALTPPLAPRYHGEARSLHVYRRQLILLGSNVHILGGATTHAPPVLPVN